jgi:hypothetical protein
MSRWFLALSFGGSILAAFGCNDETVEIVDKQVCYSEMRWVGEKRGSPEMFPGRDCVGCHIDNDGPPLALGGTLYAYVLQGEEARTLQTGTDCFGIEGATVRVEDGEGQVFEVITNKAGNFYVEGNPDDFAKPFQVEVQYRDQTARMATNPSYGGCARCHDPSVQPAAMFDQIPPDDKYQNGTARIGLPGYRPDGPDSPSVEQELRTLAGVEED